MSSTTSDLTHRQQAAGWRRLFATLLDGVDRGWSVPLMLMVFAAAWMVILQLAYLNAGLHPDVIETWSVGRTLDWGNPKHPPLMGWVAHGWTALFPLTDWSMQLLSLVNATLGLFFVDLISRRFVSGDKRAVVLLLAMVLPAYQFHAQRFNANAILLAVWPLAIYCFLRSFETRTVWWSVAAGATAAVAMLGKYYSVFLILSFAFAAAAHPQRRDYFLSRAPWVSALAGLFALGPHLDWLWVHDFPTFAYAARLHVGLTAQEGAWNAVKFVLGLAGWLLVPAITWIAIARPKFATSIPHFGMKQSGLVLLALIFAGTIVFPVATAVIGHTSLPGLWALQGLFLPILIVVCACDIGVTRRTAIDLSGAVAIATLIVVLAAPLHSAYRNDHIFKEDRNFYAPLAAELGMRWREATDAPMERISGDTDLALALSFYHPDHPRFSQPVRIDEQGRPATPLWLDKPGWVAVCNNQDSTCDALEQQAQDLGLHPVRLTFDLRSMLLGWPGATSRLHALMTPPPQTEQVPAPSPTRDDSILEFSASRRRADLIHR